MATKIDIEQKLSAQEILMLKAYLNIEGVRLDPSAMVGIGEKYQEVVHFSLDITYGTPEGLVHPMVGIITQADTCFNFTPNPNSPYVIRRIGDNGNLGLYRTDELICWVEFPLRPRYYGHMTSAGVEIQFIAPFLYRNNQVIFCYPYCHNWATGKQCRYCNFMPTVEAYRKLVGPPKLSLIREVCEYLRDHEDIYPMAPVYMPGLLPGRGAVEIALRYADIFRETFPNDPPPFWNLSTGVPEEFKDLDLISQAGYTHIGLHMEIWDKAWFEAVCPGKAEKIGRDKWLDGIIYASEVFGPRNIRCVFVAGIEPKESVLEGIDYLASKGVWGVALPWIPGPGSKLEGHRTPPPEWHAQIAKENVRIWEHHGFKFEEYDRGAAHGGGFYLLLQREAWLALREERGLL